MPTNNSQEGRISSQPTGGGNVPDWNQELHEVLIIHHDFPAELRARLMEVMEQHKLTAEQATVLIKADVSTNQFVRAALASIDGGNEGEVVEIVNRANASMTHRW